MSFGEVSCVSLGLASYQGRLVDALGQNADEGRVKQRYSRGSRTEAVISRFPNGGTRPG